MALREMNNRICCVECDQEFDAARHLVAGGRCTNSACASQRSSVRGDLLAQIDELISQGAKSAALVRALTAMVPLRADSIAAQDAQLLATLKSLGRVVEQISTRMEPRDLTNTTQAVDVGPQKSMHLKLRSLGHELDGVVLNVEDGDGDGFDAVCLGTIKRVRDALDGIATPQS